MRTSVKNVSKSTRVHVFVLFIRAKPSQDAQTLPWLQFNIYKIWIWTTYLYTLYNNLSKLQLLQKMIRPMAFKITVHALKSAHGKHLNHVPSGLKCHSNPELEHSIMPLSPWFSFWFIFYWFWLSLHFLSLHLLFSILFQDLAFPSLWLAVIAFSRSFHPFLWFGSVKNRRRFGLHATTGMCHSCIVSACEHTNIIGHCDDILLMAFWYAIVMFSQNKKGETKLTEESRPRSIKTLTRIEVISLKNSAIRDPINATSPGTQIWHQTGAAGNRNILYHPSV